MHSLGRIPRCHDAVISGFDGLVDQLSSGDVDPPALLTRGQAEAYEQM